MNGGLQNQQHEQYCMADLLWAGCDETAPRDTLECSIAAATLGVCCFNEFMALVLHVCLYATEEHCSTGLCD